MNDRLFDVDEIPEVPLFPETRRAQAARGVALDARFANDYPPSWHRCVTCRGTGIGRWPGFGPQVSEQAEYPMPPKCHDCLGMGSLKAVVRLLAGHRCVRCLHPYMPKGDAKMLGVDPSPFQWSPCDELCTHDGPICFRAGEALIEATKGPLPSLANGLPRAEWEDVRAEWRILTVHHLDGDKANCRWWNLAALCQRCHLEIQAKVVMERVYPFEHSAWFKPYVAGYYAFVYLKLELTREQVLERMDEMLALEHTA